MIEIRCKRCNRLLLKGDVRSVEVKCPKCKMVNKISFRVKPGFEVTPLRSSQYKRGELGLISSRQEYYGNSDMAGFPVKKDRLQP